MTYTRRMHDALKRLERQRQEQGKSRNMYDDLIDEIDRLNAEIDELKDRLDICADIS